MKYYLKQCINFKVNVWRPLVAFVFLGSILTGCVDSTDNPVDPGQETATGDDASDKMPSTMRICRMWLISPWLTSRTC